MRTEHGSDSKPSWTKKVVRRWLNLLPTATELNPHPLDKDYCTLIPPPPPSSSSSSSSTTTTTTEEQRVRHHKQVHGLTRRKSCSDENDILLIHDDLRGTADNLRRNRFRSEGSSVSYAAVGQNHRMFVGTWNVGGRSPHDHLNLRDWLCTPASSDVYVLGFQEIVPLNAGNVMVTKDRIPAAKWNFLIGRALNFPNESRSESTTSQQHPDRFPKPRVSFSDLMSIDDDDDVDVDEEHYNGEEWGSPSTNPNSSDDDVCAEVFPVESSGAGRTRKTGHVSSSKYRLAASKQMVGIFLCVWVRGDLFPQLSRVKASCVARGVMGYMGNKGSISISMTMRDTTFCFVCTHLTSGEKEKDEIKRNSDVVEILKRTRFRHSTKKVTSSRPNPKTILEHDKVIWLGDLNYRLTSTCEETHKLLSRNDWNSLLEMDQLRIEQKAGRIFEGWEEGKIYFPPTYKYLTNSDRYAVQTTHDANPKHKRRTPAWCDRILWRGEGMKQICYVRGESKFSDHRPVYSIFSVQVPDTNDQVQPTVVLTPTPTTNKNTTTLWSIIHKEEGVDDRNGRWPKGGSTAQTATTSSSSNNDDDDDDVANTCGREKVESEVLHLVPVTRTRSCIDTSRYVQTLNRH